MLRILRSRFDQITERGNEFIQKWIQRAIEADGFLLIGVYGDRGFGKSTLALNMVYSTFKALYPEKDESELWDLTLKHLVFTVEDFSNACRGPGIIKWNDGRVPILLWDDFALHTSSYAFMRGEGGKIGEFLEDFQAVREDVAVVVITCATPEMIPPKMREEPQIHIKMVKRGKGKVYVKEEEAEGRTLFDKILVWRYTITSSKVPDEWYNKYRELKRKAHEIKKKQRLIRVRNKAEELAEKIKEWEWNDKIILCGYGIIDTFDNITGFGELVIRAYVEKFRTLPPLPEGIELTNELIDYVKSERSSIENASNRFSLREEFRKKISQRKFERLGMSCGLQLHKLRTFYKLLLDHLDGYAEVMN